MASNAIRIAVLANVKDAIKGLHKVSAAVKKLDRDVSKSTRALSNFREQFSGLERVVGKAASGLKAGGKALGASLMGFVAVGIASGVGQVASALSAGILATLPALGVLPAFALVAASAFGVLKVATSGLSDTMALGFKAATTGAKKDIVAYSAALDKLAPAAADVVKRIIALAPALRKVRNAIAGATLGGFAAEIRKLSSTYLPEVERHGVAVGGSMNQAALGVGAFVRESSTVKRIGGIFRNVETAISNITAGVPNVVRGLLPLFTVSSTFLPQLTAGFGKAADRFVKFMEAAEKSGDLKAFIQGGLAALKNLMSILGNVGGILKSVFVDGNKGAGSFFTVIGEVLAQVDRFLNTAGGMKAIGAVWQTLGAVGKALGDALKVVLPELGKALVAIAPSIGPLAKAMSKFLQTLAPILPVVGKLAAVIADNLAKALPILAPMLLDVGKTLGDLLTRLAPVIPVIAKIVAVIGKALVKAVDKLMPYLPPLVLALGDGLLKVVTALAPALPVLAEIFGKLMKAVTPLIKPITDLISEFVTGLLPSIVKLMPSLDKLLAALGPAMLSVLDAVTPAIVAIAESSAGLVDPIIALVNAVVPLIPPFAKLAVLLLKGLMPILKSSPKAITIMASSFFALAYVIKNFGAMFIGVVKGVQFLVTHAIDILKAWYLYTMALPGKMIDGLVNGLKAGWHRVTDFFSAAIDLIPDGIQKALGIHSPSKVMRDLMLKTGDGVVAGLKDSLPGIRKAVSTVSDTVTGGIGTDTAVKLKADATVSGSNAGTGALMPITINVSVANGVDPSEVGRKTVAAIEAWGKRTGRRYLVSAAAPATG